MEKIVERIIKFVLNNKKKILFLFSCIFIVSIFLMTKVNVNYNIMDYLPEDTESSVAIDVMEEEYNTNINIIRVMLKDITIAETLEYKQKLSQIDGITDVTFLDDQIDVTKPLEIYDSSIVNAWYKNNNSLITFTVDDDKQVEIIEAVQDIVKDKGIIYGDVYNTVKIQQSVDKELGIIFLFVIPLVLIILLCSTDSWFEPILFLGVIGIAIVINEGTNFFLGEVSFATKTSSAILQLAVSMDYSIFLLHRFSEYRKKEKNVEKAMVKATSKSFVSILSSGLTTVVGFAALLIMKFKLCSDMGIVMVKAIIISLICILVLLPILTVYSYKVIDKTKHKDFFPSFKKFSILTTKIRKPLMIIFILIIGISFIASKNISFNYGNSKIFQDNSEVELEKKEVEKVFGKSNTLILLVPKNNYQDEEKLIEELEELDKVTSILSYVNTVGKSVPVEYLSKDVSSLLLSEKYTRIVIDTTYSTESDETFEVVEKIRSISSKYYDDYQLIGTSASIKDMKEVVIKDNLISNIVAIVFIGIILLFTFKSLTLSIILLLVIEASIWINLAFTYFNGVELSYFSYLIISSIQLGATIDYAILFTNRYLELRNKYNPFEASTKTIEKTFKSILISSSILTIAGFILGIVSSNLVISQLGILIGRGAILSTVLVIIVLPGFLVMFDKVYKGGKRK